MKRRNAMKTKSLSIAALFLMLSLIFTSCEGIGLTRDETGGAKNAKILNFISGMKNDGFEVSTFAFPSVNSYDIDATKGDDNIEVRISNGNGFFFNIIINKKVEGDMISVGTSGEEGFEEITRKLKGILPIYNQCTTKDEMQKKLQELYPFNA